MSTRLASVRPFVVEGGGEVGCEGGESVGGRLGEGEELAEGEEAAAGGEGVEGDEGGEGGVHGGCLSGSEREVEVRDGGKKELK
jgi:hypothetical protein